ncbi:hypothetical protein [Caldithrix abyssi]
MVRGLELFKTYFKDHSDKYLLIGGAACDVLFSSAGLPFRATKDLDIVLIVEALDAEFVRKFWEFVKNGQYQIQQKSESQKKYYRFLKPGKEDFPFQLELFARNPDLLDLAEGSHLTPIPVDEDLSSLSAILMDDAYYSFILEQSRMVEEVHLATPEALLCLKVKAFLDLRGLKAEGVKIDDRDIRKHRNDVVRLTALLTERSSLPLPESIKHDMETFIAILQEEPPDVQAIARNMGLPSLDLKTVLTQLKQTFAL